MTHLNYFLLFLKFIIGKKEYNIKLLSGGKTVMINNRDIKGTSLKLIHNHKKSYFESLKGNKKLYMGKLVNSSKKRPIILEKPIEGLGQRMIQNGRCYDYRNNVLSMSSCGDNRRSQYFMFRHMRDRLNLNKPKDNEKSKKYIPPPPKNSSETESSNSSSGMRDYNINRNPFKRNNIESSKFLANKNDQNRNKEFESSNENKKPINSPKFISKPEKSVTIKCEPNINNFFINNQKKDPLTHLLGKSFNGETRNNNLDPSFLGKFKLSSPLSKLSRKFQEFDFNEIEPLYSDNNKILPDIPSYKNPMDGENLQNLLCKPSFPNQNNNQMIDNCFNNNSGNSDIFSINPENSQISDNFINIDPQQNFNQNNNFGNYNDNLYAQNPNNNPMSTNINTNNYDMLMQNQQQIEPTNCQPGNIFGINC